MSNSGLVNYVKISPAKNAGRNHVIDTISIHCMAGQLSVESCGEVFQKRDASSNYGVGPDGRIGMYVEEKDRSWCTSNGPNDNRAVTIEVASDSTPPYAVTDTAYNALIVLLVDICQRNNISQLRWRGDKSLIGQVELQNMTVHRWFSSKACPGDYLYNKHLDIANAVNARMGSPLIPPLDNIPQGSSASTTYYGTQTNTSSYVAASLTSGSTYMPSSPNSPLISYTNRIAARGSIREGAVTRITIHVAKARGDIATLAQMINSSATSFNYGIDEQGVIGLFADEPIVTNGTGSKLNDEKAINIVCMNSSNSSDWPISTATYDALIALSADIFRRNYIAKATYTKDINRDTVTLHSEFDKKSDCPGRYIESRMTQIIADINARLKEDWSKSQARLAISDETAMMVQSGINLEAIKPYVAFLDKGQLKVDFESLRTMGVVGIMVDAGYILDPYQNKLDFDTKAVYSQINQVKDAKFPFGLLWTTHAKTAEDVKLETYWLYFIVSKYPPKLGIWLNTDFGKIDSQAAEVIVDLYYSAFVSWGLKSKCGLRATKKQAELFGWPKQCSYMPLWLAGEMLDDDAMIDEILTPSFFKLDNLTNKGAVSGSSAMSSMYQYTQNLTNMMGLNLSDNQSSDTYRQASQQDFGNYIEITLPSAPNYTGTKKWESYTAITSRSSSQYKVVNASECYTDSDGFRRIEDRYLIAVGTGAQAPVGTYIDVILQDGKEIPCIVGDIKSNAHTDPATGYLYTSVNSNWCCSEFIVSKSDLDATVKKMGDCSYLPAIGKSLVVKFRVYPKNFLA